MKFKSNTKKEADKKEEPNSASKWEQLYSLAQKRKDKSDKRPDEIEFEKNPEAYTFQPNPHKKTRRGGSPSPVKKMERLQEKIGKQKQKSAFVQRERSVPPPALRGGVRVSN